MANILDYLDWFGEVSFAGSPFNEVDNLILSQLSYLDLAGSAPMDAPTPSDTLQDVSAKYFASHSKEQLYEASGFVSTYTSFLLQKAAASKRFKNVRVGFYEEKDNPQTQEQFGAVSFALPNGSYYVAFRGTDGTIHGWREDLNISFQTVAAQTDAVEYLSRIAVSVSGKLQVGGHSKGGNLAAYATAMANTSTQKRITKLWCNDAPGFLEDVVPFSKLEALVNKTSLFTPEYCIVSGLMHHAATPQVIHAQTSDADIMQHDAFTWQVLGPHFVYSNTPSIAAQHVCVLLNEVVEKRTKDERKHFADMLFGCIEACGATTTNELANTGADGIRRIWEAVNALEDPDKDVIFEFIKALIGQIVSDSLAPLNKTIAQSLQQIAVPSANYEEILNSPTPPSIEEMNEYKERKRRAATVAVPAKLVEKVWIPKT
ncbi:Mbeg1-like protein [Atopobium fossor]|uniref:Mbeg1-like protein n=1 Tax=Atopobium fossor TaxID=39487 RepID=UPI000425C0C0|nr:Mbeg1-like protein [Atopobium fossor]